MYRVLQSRLVLQLFGEESSQADLEKNIGGDFLLVPLLYELISAYEQNRRHYQDLESFMPDLLSSLEESLRDRE